MEKSINKSLEAMEAFTKTFAHFWSVAASAQAHYQQLGMLDTQTANAKNDKRDEIASARDYIYTQYEEERSKLFEIMALLSNLNGDISLPCFEMLDAANQTICVCFANLIASNEELKELFAEN